MSTSDEPTGVPELIVAAIIKDLRRRMGLGQTWDEIDVDVRNEIGRKWIALTRSECTQATRITDLKQALERTAHALELAFSRKPLRDMGETLAEAHEALRAAEKEALGPVPPPRPRDKEVG